MPKPKKPKWKATMFMPRNNKIWTVEYRPKRAKRKPKQNQAS